MRRGGFTLVELLIVIMIISIMAGMVLLSSGSATDGAEAAKIVNDLRNLKSAALLYYGDNYRWPADADKGSLDMYTDRPVVNSTRYKSVMIGTDYLDARSGVQRANIGVLLDTASNGTPGVQKKLETKAENSGLLKDGSTSDPYVAGGAEVWMNMR
jgi:general secretion pathway protein G